MPLPSSQENGRKERLAVNLADLDRMDAEVRTRLFGPPVGGRLDLSVPVRTDGDDPDEAAVGLVGPLLAAACACDAARAQDREVGEVPLRVYLCRSSSWQRLPADAQLTELDEGGAVSLNSRWFPEPVNPVPLTAPIQQQAPSRFKR